jgi:hypothetical protein
MLSNSVSKDPHKSNSVSKDPHKSNSVSKDPHKSNSVSNNKNIVIIKFIITIYTQNVHF